MAHLTCTFSSECLKMNTSITVILPEQVEMNSIKVIYLLHGLADNCSGLSRYTVVERYAREYGVAVVIPEVQRSFYTDLDMGLNYFSYVLDELPKVCQRFFGFSSKREQNYIMGLSMGGYGALKCVLNRPERFAGCAAFSPVTDIQERVDSAEFAEKQEFKAIFGTDLVVPEEGDLFKLAKTVNSSLVPNLYIACGESDELYPQNVKFASVLKEAKIFVNFEHWKGNHDWIFWDRAIERGMNMLL